MAPEINVEADFEGNSRIWKEICFYELIKIIPGVLITFKQWSYQAEISYLQRPLFFIRKCNFGLRLSVSKKILVLSLKMFLKFWLQKYLYKPNF